MSAFRKRERTLLQHDPDANAVSVGSRDQETLAHTQQSVQEIFGAADEDFKRLSAVLRPLHQAQWIQETHGESLHFGLGYTYTNPEGQQFSVQLKLLGQQVRGKYVCCFYVSAKERALKINVNLKWQKWIQMFV